jgi:hypothetical protein
MLAISIVGGAWALQPAVGATKLSEARSLDFGIEQVSSIDLPRLPNTSAPRRLLVVWLLATSGTAIALRASRTRTL